MVADRHCADLRHVRLDGHLRLHRERDQHPAPGLRHGGDAPGANISVTVNGTSSVADLTGVDPTRVGFDHHPDRATGHHWNNGTAYTGNDFAIDDIWLYQRGDCEPPCLPVVPGVWHNYTGKFTGTGTPALSDPKWKALPAQPGGEHDLDAARLRPAVPGWRGQGQGRLVRLEGPRQRAAGLIQRDRNPAPALIAAGAGLRRAGPEALARAAVGCGAPICHTRHQVTAVRRSVAERDSRRARNGPRCAAHPDDQAYLSSGLMARSVRAGQRVVCVTATRGEGGSMDEGLAVGHSRRRSREGTAAEPRP